MVVYRDRQQFFRLIDAQQMDVIHQTAAGCVFKAPGDGRLAHAKLLGQLVKAQIRIGIMGSDIFHHLFHPRAPGASFLIGLQQM